jgi:hypothetical protein
MKKISRLEKASDDNLYACMKALSKLGIQGNFLNLSFQKSSQKYLGNKHY